MSDTTKHVSFLVRTCNNEPVELKSRPFVSFGSALSMYDLLDAERCYIFDVSTSRAEQVTYDRDGLIAEIVRARIGSDINMPCHLPGVQEAVNVLSRLGINSPLG